VALTDQTDHGTCE